MFIVVTLFYKCLCDFVLQGDHSWKSPLLPIASFLGCVNLLCHSLQYLSFESSMVLFTYCQNSAYTSIWPWLAIILFFFLLVAHVVQETIKKCLFFSDKHHYTRMKTNVFIKCGTWSSAVVSVVGAKIANAEGSSYLRGFFQVHKFDLINALHFFSLCRTFSWDRVLSFIAHTRKLWFFSFKVVVSNFGWGKWIV